MSNRRTQPFQNIYRVQRVISLAAKEVVVFAGAVELNTIRTTQIFTSNTHIRIANMCRFIIYIRSGRWFRNTNKKYTNVVCLITEALRSRELYRNKEKTKKHLFISRSVLKFIDLISFFLFFSLSRVHLYYKL